MLTPSLRCNVCAGAIRNNAVLHTRFCLPAAPCISGGFCRPGSIRDRGRVRRVFVTGLHTFGRKWGTHNNSRTGSWTGEYLLAKAVISFRTSGCIRDVAGEKQSAMCSYVENSARGTFTCRTCFHAVKKKPIHVGWTSRKVYNASKPTLTYLTPT